MATPTDWSSLEKMVREMMGLNEKFDPSGWSDLFKIPRTSSITGRDLKYDYVVHEARPKRQWDHDKLRQMALINYSFLATRIVESHHMLEPVLDAQGRAVLDWSGCRSPSRARRRAKMGHPQRTKAKMQPMKLAYSLPDGTLVMHPQMVAQLKDSLP